MRPTDEPGFSKMLAEMRAEKDTRPRYLVPGWHELAIDRCLYRFNESEARACAATWDASMAGHIFVAEGRVLRSTAPDFAGQGWAYICSLKWEAQHAIMKQIAIASADLYISRLANDAEQCSRFGMRKPDQIIDIKPSATILANTVEKRMRAAPDRMIFVTMFEAATKLLLLALVLTAAVGCTTKANTKYCDAQIICPAPTVCDLVRHDCTGVAADLAVTADLADVPDLGEPADLSQLPDLNEVDLIPPADLMPPPDLEPPPVYFNPDVQAILSAGGGGGCAKASCHNASDGLYIPFLIPNPSPGPATHANFTSFTAETSTIVFQKLIKTSGVAHGGSMSAADRKPCATGLSEPCATLSRWYAAGSVEVSP